MQLGVIR